LICIHIYIYITKYARNIYNIKAGSEVDSEVDSKAGCEVGSKAGSEVGGKVNSEAGSKVVRWVVR
jgi:hypothetical protein